ncbi:MAG: phosphoribosylformylglycinamidine synthase I [Planctomycetota bacterium]|jgi:phosphoribosylformylglycinamidine synthase
MKTASRPRPTRPQRRASPRPRVVVLRAPGTNCDRETAYAFERAGARTANLHVNALLSRRQALRGAHGLAIPGGFSYGDDIGAGTVLGTRLRLRLRDEIRRLVDRGGIVLGICNGFQVLVKTGLLPGFADAPDDRSVALAANRQNRYEDRWVHLEAVSGRSVFFRPGDRIACPVAHAEGRFLTRDEAVLQRLRDEDQIGFRYLAPKGERPAPFPHNPNGSVDDIAGIVDPTGRILGMMPHPERNQFPWQDPRFHAGTAPRTPEGLLPFRNAVRHLKHSFRSK